MRDTFQHRIVDPVLQQIEQLDDPTVTVADTWPKPVTRYWDSDDQPEQIIRSLPQALAVMVDPADCGPAFFALPAETCEADALTTRASFFNDRVHYIAPVEVPTPVTSRQPPVVRAKHASR